MEIFTDHQLGHRQDHSLEGADHLPTIYDCHSSVLEHDFVYIDGSGVLQRSRADDILTANAIGIVVSKESSVICGLKYHGPIQWKDSSLVPGKIYFMSDSVFDISLAHPPQGTTGHVIKKVGIAVTDSILFDDLRNPHI